MKKLFTLLFAVGFLTAVNAQTSSRDRDNRDNRNTQQNGQWDNNNRNDVGINNGHFDNNDRYDNRFDNNFDLYNGNIRMQIAQINRKYDYKIERVKNDFFMRRYEKMRIIRSLEDQRQQEIRMAYARSNKRGQHDHDRGFDPNHRY